MAVQSWVAKQVKNCQKGVSPLSDFKFELGTQKKNGRYFRQNLVQKKILERAGHPQAEISTKTIFKIFNFRPIFGQNHHFLGLVSVQSAEMGRAP